MNTAVAKLLDGNGGVGLVLSGGGARGAYQVGIIRCLAQHNIRIRAVAGASVGALNGALVASEPDLAVAAKRLEALWCLLADSPPAEIRLLQPFPGIALGLYLSLLVASGQQSRLDLLTAAVARLARAASASLETRKWNGALAAILKYFELRAEIFQERPLAELVDCYLEDDALSRGVPLYVSLFRSQGVLWDLAWAAGGASGFTDTPNSEYIHVQSLPQREFRTAILASAALPLLFEAGAIGGARYSDGGIGGWARCQGNTPAAPLLEDAGCRCLIVTHTMNGSLWDRNAFPDATMIEIRPAKTIGRNGGLSDMLGFRSSSIRQWINQGHEDTERCLMNLGCALEVIAAHRKAGNSLGEAMASLAASNLDEITPARGRN